MTTHNTLLWIHLLAAVGTFGGLVALRFGLSATARHDAAHVRGAYRLLAIMLVVGLLAGLTLYYQQIRIAGDSGGLASATHMKIGIKMLILVAVGGCVGMASAVTRKGRGATADGMLIGAVGLLAVAAALGVWI